MTSQHLILAVIGRFIYLNLVKLSFYQSDLQRKKLFKCNQRQGYFSLMTLIHTEVAWIDT